MDQSVSISMNSKYIIITPAYNEAKYIESTIKSVIVQTRKPLLWVIVDDGSTDSTAEIIKRYAAQHGWISYFFNDKNKTCSYYASNVYAIQKGIEQCRGLEYDYLAILDADISLSTDYYETILMRMKNNDRLGIASGVYVDNVNGRHRQVLHDRRSTPKALMVFRKECFEDIGGFIPMKYGGEDTCACFMARKSGWLTWSYPDIVAVHNKPIGTGHAKNKLKIHYRQGFGEYFLATHPLFFFLKSLRRCLKESPFLLGGIARLAGYMQAYFMKEKHQIPDDLKRYIHKEQLGRVLKMNKIPVKHQVYCE